MSCANLTAVQAIALWAVWLAFVLLSSVFLIEGLSDSGPWRSVAGSRMVSFVFFGFGVEVGRMADDDRMRFVRAGYRFHRIGKLDWHVRLPAFVRRKLRAWRRKRKT